MFVLKSSHESITATMQQRIETLQLEEQRLRRMINDQDAYIEKLKNGEALKPGDPVALRIGRDHYGDMIYLRQLPFSTLHQCAYLDGNGEFQTIDLPYAAIKRIEEPAA